DRYLRPPARARRQTRRDRARGVPARDRRRNRVRHDFARAARCRSRGGPQAGAGAPHDRSQRRAGLRRRIWRHGRCPRAAARLAGGPDVFARPRGHRASIARAPGSVDRGVPGEHRGRCADQLRLRPHGAVLRHRELCPPDCTGRQTLRHADRAIAALLHGGQPEDGGIARRFFIGRVHRPGQRGDRMRRRATSSLPGLTRQSILLRKKMDARVKPAHDGSTTSAIVLRRRELIALLAGAAVAWPRAARAQQGSGMRRIGALMAASENDPEYQAFLATFREGLQKLGWAEGRNIQLDHRRAGLDPEATRRLAKELVGLAPDLILSSSTFTTAALLQQTRTIPIIFANIVDPVGSGFVASLPRPGGNVTGFINLEPSMVGKWLELLKEIAPRVARVAAVYHPQTAPYVQIYLDPFKATA